MGQIRDRERKREKGKINKGKGKAKGKGPGGKKGEESEKGNRDKEKRRGILHPVKNRKVGACGSVRPSVCLQDLSIFRSAGAVMQAVCTIIDWGRVSPKSKIEVIRRYTRIYIVTSKQHMLCITWGGRFRKHRQQLSVFLHLFLIFALSRHGPTDRQTETDSLTEERARPLTRHISVFILCLCFVRIIDVFCYIVSLFVVCICHEENKIRAYGRTYLLTY